MDDQLKMDLSMIRGTVLAVKKELKVNWETAALILCIYEIKALHDHIDRTLPIKDSSGKSQNEEG